MLTLDQKVSIHCTDTDATAEGVIIRIRPDGFDAALKELVISADTSRAFMSASNRGWNLSSEHKSEDPVETPEQHPDGSSDHADR